MNWPYQFEEPGFKCPKCGSGMANEFPADSMFYRIMCEKADCGYYGVSFLVEKATRCMITSSAMGDDNGEPIWPADWVNRAGEYVVRGGKPVLKIADEPISYGGQYRSSGADAPSRATPKFDPADLVYAKMKAATENMARQADLAGTAQQQDFNVDPPCPESLEMVAWTLVGTESFEKLKQALHMAYVGGMRSKHKNDDEPWNRIYEERMEK